MMERGSVHTPVADGECIDCHSPHGGDNSFFLKYPPAVIDGTRIISPTCKACHEDGDPDWFDEFHAGEIVLDCVVCHNAHASSETYQLTRYVRSVYLKSTLMEAADLKKDGRLDAAAEAYSKALTLFPKDVKTILLLAGVHESRGAWGEALGEYEKVLALEPANMEALVRAAGAAGKRDDQGTEMAYLKKALDVERRPDIHHRLGKIYHSRGQLQEAISEFSKATGIDPKYAPARSDLAEIYDEMGMTRDAEEERRLLRELQ
jgi:predicted CXXCH cytochrome family protein